MAKVVVRLKALQVAFALGVLVLLGRAVQLQLVRGPRYAAIADSQRTERVELPARRGTLYDRNGVPLALTQRMFRVGVAPDELTSPRADAERIASALGLPVREVRRALRKPYAYFHGPYSSAAVEPIRELPAVYPEAVFHRFHPDPDFAQPLLGSPAIEGRSATGLERALDDVLAGTDGSAVVLRDGVGRRYESPSRLDAFPVPGHDVYLTLDAGLQEIVEEALRSAVDRFDALGGDVVALNPESGEILAVASEAPAGTRTTTAFTAVFEPGSTAKLFVAAALLEHGLVDPTDSVWTEGAYERRDRVIRDEHPLGWLTLREVIERSSNIGIVKFADALTPARQYTTLRDFGLGSPTGVEYPAESPGILKRPVEWSGTTAASLAMGYEVAVTPLQLAQAYAAIANDGVLMRPTLIREVRAADGTVVHRHRPEPVRRVVPPEAADDLRRMLKGVVYGGGTGANAALSSYEVGGKTGTARRAGPDGYIPGSYTASFASIFPAEDPQLVMVVKLDDPQGTYAQLTAAPVSRMVLERMLATQTAAIDRRRLSARVSEPAAPAAPADTGAITVPWPAPPAPAARPPRPVPDVTGRSLRDAARRLHAAGFEVRVRGWGIVTTCEPGPGTSLAPGSVITLVAEAVEP